MLTLDKSKPVMGVPPAFKQRCAVRILEAKFGMSKKDKPMITIESELVGFFDDTNELQTSIKRGDKVFNLNGLKLRNDYFTLTQEALPYYAIFYKGATGNDLEVIDETNPDIAYMEGLVMQAVVRGNMVPYLEELTEEEKQAKLAIGERAIGKPLRNEDGTPIEKAEIRTEMWLRAYTKPLPEKNGE